MFFYLQTMRFDGPALPRSKCKTEGAVSFATHNHPPPSLQMRDGGSRFLQTHLCPLPSLKTRDGGAVS